MTAIQSARSSSDLLGAIVASSRRIVATRQAAKPMQVVENLASMRSPDGARFRESLAAAGQVNVIAECKRRSPSRGILSDNYQPALIAQSYERGGAAAVSVLTEPAFFDGSLEHLEAVRAAVSLPVLRKDFIVDPYQLLEARASGADAVLLIVAALEANDLAHLVMCATQMGLAALVETHTSDEVRQAVDAGATIIGVNSRNLKTLEVDRQACDALAGQIPGGCVAVAESGIRSADGVRHLYGLGYQAVLIGEWLMTSPDPAATLRSAIDSSVRSHHLRDGVRL